MYIIRKFQAKDTFPVVHLASNVLTEHYNPSIFSYLYETNPWGFLVCEFQDKIIGFIIGIRFQENTGRILMVGIEKSFRRQGIAQSLFKELLKEFREQFITTIELEVKTTNYDAICFYQKHHFKIVEKVPHFYQNGEDAFIMELRLQGH